MTSEPAILSVGCHTPSNPDVLLKCQVLPDDPSVVGLAILTGLCTLIILAVKYYPRDTEPATKFTNNE